MYNWIFWLEIYNCLYKKNILVFSQIRVLSKLKTHFFTASYTWRDIPTAAPLYLVSKRTIWRSTNLILCYVMFTACAADCRPIQTAWMLSEPRTTRRPTSGTVGVRHPSMLHARWAVFVERSVTSSVLTWICYATFNFVYGGNTIRYDSRV